ncbi:unnamed protein product [Adineta steineri]|uniref:Ketoreductase domain-containing protein n=1 Tax=Adineta steineri TaxID=433720 RepID=A0A814ZHH3_9BILA|nr:unnamed protein product [Adineta steineri]CAF1529886.1 unnamed protein product [Adineta steineri]
MFLAILFQIFLYFGIILLVTYWLYPSHVDIEEYFQNKVVWITGASSDTGRELVKQLARHSPTTRLILSGTQDQKLDKLAKELQLDSDHCLVLPLDLERQHDFFKSKIDLVLERFGQIDVLINNAGISHRDSIQDTGYNVDARLMNVNYLGTITLSKTVLEHFIERQQGHFVVVSSIASYVGSALYSSYAASKHALRGFFDCLRLEHARDHIDVTIVCPDFIRTAILPNALEDLVLKYGKMYSKPDPSKYACDILRGIANRKHEIYVSHLTSILIYLRRFFPQLLYYILSHTKSIMK